MDEEPTPDRADGALVRDDDVQLTEGTTDPSEAPETSVSWVMGVTLAVPVFAVILMFMLRLFGGPTVGPITPNDPPQN